MSGIPLPRITKSQMMAVRNVCFHSVATKIEKDMSKAMDQLTGGIHDAIEDSTAEMNEALNACEALHVQNTKAFNFYDAICSSSINQKGKALMHLFWSHQHHCG